MPHHVSTTESAEPTVSVPFSISSLPFFFTLNNILLSSSSHPSFSLLCLPFPILPLLPLRQQYSASFMHNEDVIGCRRPLPYFPGNNTQRGGSLWSQTCRSRAWLLMMREREWKLEHGRHSSSAEALSLHSANGDAHVTGWFMCGQGCHIQGGEV